jgi:hypothetical protein
LAGGSAIDFGTVMTGSTASRKILLKNASSGTMTIQHVAVAYVAQGSVGLPPAAPFQWKGVTLPLELAAQGSPNDSASIEVDFTPLRVGPQPSWALEIDQHSQIALTGVGVYPPLPQPSITFDNPSPASAEQVNLTVRLGAPSQAPGTGEAQIDFNPNAIGAGTENGIVFLATGNRTATFSVNPGDTIGRFGNQDSTAFQTGTTAGDLVFTVKLGDLTATKTITIARAPVGFDSSQAQRTSAGLDLRIDAFDNTRSASKLIFTFLDRNGATLNSGAMTVDRSADFQQFFGSSDLGGVFSLHAFFPVIGDPAQVDSVQVGIVNSAGTAQSGKLPFTTP